MSKLPRICGKGHEWLPSEKIRQCPTCMSVWRKARRLRFLDEEKKQTAEWIANNRERWEKKRAEWKARHPGINCYRAMLRRCNSPTNKNYKHYGGRGIKVCDRWIGKDGYANFLADLGPRPSMEYTLERKKVNGNYEPDNCCWVTQQDQVRNRRTSIMVTINGETKCMSAWAKVAGITASAFAARYKSGKTGEDLLRPTGFFPCKETRLVRAIETLLALLVGVEFEGRTAIEELISNP